MKPAMKQNAGATGIPVNRVRNCQMSEGKAGAAAANSSPPRPPLSISEA